MKRNLSRRRSEKQIKTRLSAEGEGANIKRTRSDRLKPELRNMKNSVRFCREKSHLEKRNNAQKVLNTAEDEALDDAVGTVKIDMSDDIIEIVISTKEDENTDLKHEVTDDEAECVATKNSHSLILSAVDLGEKMSQKYGVQGDREGGVGDHRERHSTS